jgi:hypothetical protein
MRAAIGFASYDFCATQKMTTLSPQLPESTALSLPLYGKDYNRLL